MPRILRRLASLATSAILTPLSLSRRSSQVFAVLFSAFATAAIGGSFLNKALMGSGFDSIFKVMAVLSVFAGGLVSTLGDV